MEQTENPKNDEAAQSAQTEMKNGLREDYLEEKDNLRKELVQRLKDGVQINEPMRRFFGIAMRVRDAEYAKRDTEKTYENAILSIGEIYQELEKLPTKQMATTE